MEFPLRFSRFFGRLFEPARGHEEILFAVAVDVADAQAVAEPIRCGLVGNLCGTAMVRRVYDQSIVAKPKAPPVVQISSGFESPTMSRSCGDSLATDSKTLCFFQCPATPLDLGFS